MEQFRAAGSIVGWTYYLALKAESLQLAGRTAETLAAIRESEARTERFGERAQRAKLHRLRGVFLAAIGADHDQIEASFCEATRIAKEQKSVSLEKRAEEPTRNTAANKRARRAGVESGYHFAS